MQPASTYFLRAVIFLIGLAILALYIFGIPVIARDIAAYIPEYRYLNYFTLMCVYATLIPSAIALYQGQKLLGYINQNIAFSKFSVRSLKLIKYCALTVSGLYLLCMPLIFIVAEKDDAPGLVIIGMTIACAPLVIAVMTAVLQKLVQSAIDLKSENDLTV